MQSGASSWVSPQSAAYAPIPREYYFTTAGAIQVSGEPDGTTPLALWTVGSTVALTGGVSVTITSINSPQIGTATVAATSGRYTNQPPFSQDTVTLSNGQVQTVMGLVSNMLSPLGQLSNAVLHFQ